MIETLYNAYRSFAAVLALVTLALESVLEWRHADLLAATRHH